MTDSEVLRRQIALLLTETEKLPSITDVLNMTPAECADAITASWDLRYRWQYICDELDSKVSYGSGNNLWKNVAVTANELLTNLKRHDRCQVELLALTRRSVADCAAEIRKAEEVRFGQIIPDSDY